MGRAMVRYMLGSLPMVQNIKNMEVCYVLKTISSCCYYTNICYSGLLTILLTYVGYFIEYWCDFVAPRYEYSMPCSIVKCLMMWVKNHEIIHPSRWLYWTTITYKNPRKYHATKITNPRVFCPIPFITTKQVGHKHQIM